MSVVITTFNTGRYLPETLESVFAQSYPAAEVIVVDDGSTDDTVAVARSYGSRITLVERPHEGLGPARNAGLALATGDYVAFLDSDDLWEPDALRIQVDVAQRHPESGLIVGDAVEFADDTVISPQLLSEALVARIAAAPGGELTARMYHEVLLGCPVSCPAQTLVPRWAVQAVGGVTLADHRAPDYDYYLRIARRFPLTFHRTPVARWRFRADSMSGPRELRGINAAAVALILLEGELRACAPEDRAAVERAITHQARHGCADLAHQRLEHGASPQPDALATIARLRPRDPVVTLLRAAFALPHPLDRWALITIRDARGAARWTARRLRRRPA